MGNTTDYTDEKSGMTFKKGKAPVTMLMAYTINDYQPVQCTMISDQPFFYMDEDINEEDETLFSEEMSFDLDEIEEVDLENELMKMKSKIDAYERISLNFSKCEDQRQREFIIDGQFMTSPITTKNTDSCINRIKQVLSESRYTRALMDFALKNEIQIEISNQVATAAYDKKAGKIFIRGALEFADQILLCVQELRRHWQHHHGALVHPLTFHPDHAILINRAQMADLSVAVVRAAWELKLSGHSELWARVENSSLSDLGRALAREALSDFRTLNNGKAASAVFETWFLSERCRAQDKKLIQAMLADYRGYVFGTTEASRMVSIDLMSALGEQPIGKNYLAVYAHMIINDTLFKDVRDRSNANFLWFIKFEREFTETEQELQSSNLINTSGVSDQMENKDIIEDTNHDNIFSAEAKEQLRYDIFGGQNASSGNNVVHVQFGKGRDSREGVLS